MVISTVTCPWIHNSDKPSLVLPYSLLIILPLHSFSTFLFSGEDRCSQTAPYQRKMVNPCITAQWHMLSSQYPSQWMYCMTAPDDEHVKKELITCALPIANTGISTFPPPLTQLWTWNAINIILSSKGRKCVVFYSRKYKPKQNTGVQRKSVFKQHNQS